MSYRESICSIKDQQGITLLALVLGIFLIISSYYFSSISIIEVKVNKVEKTQKTLKRAKQALLDYAQVNWYLAGEAGKIGKLPCPDYRDTTVDIDGEQDGSCGDAYANGIGYFPWRTLGLDITKDGSGSCLLYAVSPGYKTSPFVALNPDSYGQFRIVNNIGVTLQGETPDDRPVAVIIAPDYAVIGQARESNGSVVCGSYYSNNITNLISAYLDDNSVTNNASIDPTTENIIENFVSKYDGSDSGSNPLNDRVITISHREFWQVMQSTITGSKFNDRMVNLTEAIASCFAAYGNSNPNNNLPMPALLDLNEYRRNIDYDDNGIFTNAFAGRLPYDVDRANIKIPNMVLSKIFDNTFCDALELTSTAELDNVNFTNDTGGDKGEYFDLWQNWKDHFFYVVSERFKPGGTGGVCSGDCVTYNGTDYAALVIFSGLKQGIQSRYAPPLEAIDEKLNTNNYLEEGRAGVFPDNAGNDTYPVVTAASNDVVFCIETNMDVVAC